jgi:hypothetical protein
MTVPSPAALDLAINYRLATFGAALYPAEPDNLTDRILTQARYYLGTPYRRDGSFQSK